MIPAFGAMALYAGLTWHVGTPAPPPTLAPLMDSALAALQAPLTCHVEVLVQGDDSYATSDGQDYCAITFDTHMWDDDDLAWWTPYTIRHEVAHLVTRTEPITHGPLFRLEEARLLAPLGIRLEYGTREYPDRIYLHDQLVGEEVA